MVSSTRKNNRSFFGRHPLSRTQVSTYKIRVRNEQGQAITGTIFTIEVDGTHYFITARHIAKHITELCEIQWEQGWQLVPVRLVGNCKGKIDISVFSTDQDLARMLLPEWKSPQLCPNLILGEEIRFYGFPLGMETSRGNNKAPIPLVKGGLISGFHGSEALDDRSSFFIDGQNNPGFSGGPVVAVRNGSYALAGVISGYIPVDSEVYSHRNGGETESNIGIAQLNAGIMVAYNILYAMDVIGDHRTD